MTVKRKTQENRIRSENGKSCLKNRQLYVEKRGGIAYFLGKLLLTKVTAREHALASMRLPELLAKWLTCRFLGFCGLCRQGEVL